MSDIWSLGCVFMEMIAVLKGKTRAFVFEALGDLTCPRFCRSITGITTLLQDLRKIQPEYNSPLDWIEKMLKEDPEARPPATNLRSMISQTDGSDYFGICCRNKSLLQVCAYPNFYSTSDPITWMTITPSPLKFPDI